MLVKDPHKNTNIITNNNMRDTELYREKINVLHTLFWYADFIGT